MNQKQDDKSEQRAIEALAQALYEAHDPAGISWAKRARVIREPWLAQARQQLTIGEV